MACRLGSSFSVVWFSSWFWAKTVPASTANTTVSARFAALSGTTVQLVPGRCHRSAWPFADMLRNGVSNFMTRFCSFQPFVHGAFMSSYFLPYQNSFSVSRPRGLRGFPHLAVRAAVERGFAQLGSEDFAEDSDNLVALASNLFDRCNR